MEPNTSPSGELDLTLFVACYNEERNIVGTLDTLLAALKGYAFTWEIIIIDDASSDRSVAVIQDFMASHPGLPIRLERRMVNAGLGQNFVDAAFLGKGKHYRLICGDNVEPVETLVEVFRHVGEADLVLFYHSAADRTLVRGIVSKCFTFLINRITGYRIRYYNGLAILQRYHVMRWHTSSYGFGFQADLIARLLDQGFTYVEVPVKVSDRVAGSSSAFRFRNLLSVAHTMVNLFIRRITKRRVPKGGASAPFSPAATSDPR
ncbi:MAG: glycosyltransferase family 2 protein [Planctomycetota bacterium]|nr:glycosyltransferase family 2 protein [Planctomycetota bacterium]